MPDKKIAIAGAGITGLVTAFVLQQNGIVADIYERREQAGGAIRTAKTEGWQYEYGPNTLLLKDREVSGFLDRLGLGDQILIANPAASKRYIVKDGELQPLPSSFIDAIRTPLFSFGGKLRVLAEPFRGRANHAGTGEEKEDETLASFVERRLGQQVLDYAINPFVAGIYASQPEQLSVRHAFPLLHNLEQEYGSLIVGSLLGRKKRKAAGRVPRKLISFKEGMQALPDAIVAKLNGVHTGAEVTAIRRHIDGWMLQVNGKEKGPYTDVVVNVPLTKWSRDLMPVSDPQLSVLQQVTYQPLSVLIAGYRKEDIVHLLDGFGFLVPEAEGRSILGGLFSSTLFPGRAPEGHHLLTIFIGGGRQPQDAALPSEELFKRVEKELFELTGLTGEPVFRDHIYWPNAIPSYHTGYDDVLAALQSFEKENPGLHAAGNFRGGISVPDCIRNGLELGGKLSGVV